MSLSTQEANDVLQRDASTSIDVMNVTAHSTQPLCAQEKGTKTTRTPSQGVLNHQDRGNLEPRHISKPIINAKNATQACVRVHRFKKLLDGFPQKDYLVNGFSEGFKIHFVGPNEPLMSRNSHTTRLNPTAVDDKLHEEISVGRIKGPFDSPPFRNFKCSPLALREKSTKGKYRLLHNLSYPYDNLSVNNNIPQNFKTVQYASINDAIRLVQRLGPCCYLAKSDIKNAFRLVPIHPSCYHLLGFKWKGKFYYDTALPMGLGESCKIFETISDGIKYILNKFGVVNMVKILDDFLFGGVSKRQCQLTLDVHIRLLNYLNIPIAWDKTSDQPTHVITFLGVQINTLNMTSQLPIDKLERYSNDIDSALDRSSMQIREIQAIIGKLQFATCVVPCGKAFLRRMINLLPKTRLYKPHWKIRIHRSSKQDLTIWRDFLLYYNGITIIKQTPILTSNAVNIYTDASGWGYSGTFNGEWFQGKWPAHWSIHDIAVKEIFPIYLLIAMFSYELQGCRVVFHCDNQAIVSVLNKQTSRNKKIMKILRPLVLVLLKNNIRFRALYINTSLNVLADHLSRFQADPEFLRIHGLNYSQIIIPEHLKPENWRL